jgi:hypothetical protein
LILVIVILIVLEPKVRYEHAFSARPWGNGQRKDQFMFAIDALTRLLTIFTVVGSGVGFTTL